MQAFGTNVEETEVSRSFLFVPGDNERKLEKATTTNADALIIDLEDSVIPDARPAARKLAASYLQENHAQDVWVRINPLDTSDSLEDLRALIPSSPFGIVLPKPENVSDTHQLAKLCDALEAENDLPLGQTKILPIATERPATIFSLHEYTKAPPRLAGLTWGAEDLSTAVGATATRENGRWLGPYELARSLCLFAAAAASVPAIDTVYTDFKDLDGLAEYAHRANRDGFEGMLAIHPDQVPVINEAFMPSATVIERAERIVELFRKNPDSGALGMDGEMIDRPHWVQAKRILKIAKKDEYS